ncbi:hypothetical protein [Stenotrophomonas sp. PS02297]|uniref:hypothetical protein n=1 Tax=Stenotrophomonas sp. PS02297 TaxID=2991423 RepID=UPI00249A9836|nr:hypothetical protein [Stenotrophomonas sp. PS02297]
MRDEKDPGTMEMELPQPVRKRGRPCKSSTGKPMDAATRAYLYRRRRVLGALRPIAELSDALLIDSIRRNVREGDHDVRDMYIEELVRRHHSSGKVGEDALYAVRKVS